MYTSNSYSPVIMSGSAILTQPTGTQDDDKFLYHSVSMEPPGGVVPYVDKSRYQSISRDPPPHGIPLTDRSRYSCANSRKVLTLILLSAILWIIVLDVMLVVYKSRHLNMTEHLSTVNSKGLLSSGDEVQKQRFTVPPSDGRQVRAVSIAPAVTDAPTPVLENTMVAKRFDVSIIEDSVHPPFPDWLSRFHHRNIAPPHPKPGSTHTPSGDSAPVTPSGIFPRMKHRQLPPPPPPLHAGPFPFPLLPPLPPPFLSPRLHHFRDLRPRRPWSGRWGARERAASLRSDGARTPWGSEDGKRDGPIRGMPGLPPIHFLPPPPIVEIQSPFPRPWVPVGEEIHGARPWERDDEMRSLPLSNSPDEEKSHEEDTGLSSFFMKLVSSLFDRPVNATAETDRAAGDHESTSMGVPEIKVLKISRNDDDDDDDDGDTVIDIDIFPEKL